MMKRWINKLMIVFIFSSFLLLNACKEQEEVKVSFVIDENIEITLEEYHEGYNFEKYIKAYRNDEVIPYEKLRVYFSGSINPGLNRGIVEYSEEEIVYSQVFYVYMKKEENICRVYYGKMVKNLEIVNGSVSLVDTILVDGEVMKVVGYYVDEAYQVKYEMNTPLKNGSVLYALLEYDINYIYNEVNKENINEDLKKYITNLISTTPSYIPSWNKEGFKGRWNYIDGVFLNFIIKLYYQTNENSYKDFFINYINYYIDSEGNFINPKDNSNGYREGELDSVCASSILFDAYALTNDERYIKAINKTFTSLTNMPRCVNGINFSHKTNYKNQIWLDGMYMYVPFYLKYAKLNNIDYIFDEVFNQYKYIRENMYDDEKGLYYHAYDTSKSIFWADETGCSQNFWLRSNGWLLMSLTEAIEYFDDGEQKEYLVYLLNELLDNIFNYQDSKTKLFYQLIDKANTAYYVSDYYLGSLKNTSNVTAIKNYIESSGSAMIAYSAIKASKLGYVDCKYNTLGCEVFERLYDYSFKNNALENICITAGLGGTDKPYRDGTIGYYLSEKVGSDDAKGVAPFLLAYLEYMKSE